MGNLLRISHLSSIRVFFVVEVLRLIFNLDSQTTSDGFTTWRIQCTASSSTFLAFVLWLNNEQNSYVNFIYQRIFVKSITPHSNRKNFHINLLNYFAIYLIQFDLWLHFNVNCVANQMVKSRFHAALVHYFFKPNEKRYYEKKLPYLISATQFLLFFFNKKLFNFRSTKCVCESRWLK